MVKMLAVIGLSLFAGILGRLGGAHGHNTKFRDLGLPACWVASLLVLRADCPWWGFLLAFGALFGACTTYYDELFGYDNLWFSGFIAGIAAFPVILFTGHWWLFIIRAVLLAIIWGSLNRWLPERILLWRRDVAEEFLRYASVVATSFMV